LKKALKTIPAQIRLESTRALAWPKIVVLSTFPDAVADEDQGALE